MLDLITDTLIDSLKILPFLFISYLIIEFIEHKSSKKIKNTLSKSGKFGPIIGGVLGIIPQCGFSVTASTLYASRVITLGTLIAVFLTTSDEAIPVLLSTPGSFGILLKIILFKLVIGIICGFIIDLVYRKKHTPKDEFKNTTEHIHTMCSNCNCKTEGILKPTLKHTFNVFIFIIIFNFLLNLIIFLIGEENLSKVLMSGSIFQPLITSLIGMIPNCASSVVLTELFLAGKISFASIISGLSCGSGLGIAILFKENKNIKENIRILILIYFIAVFFGFLLEIFNIV